MGVDSSTAAKARRQREIIAGVPSEAPADLTGDAMRLEGRFVFVAVAMVAVHIPVTAHAQTPDDSLKIYAVNVVKTPPFQKQFTGYGIYLGQGAVITAAHVVGHWPFFTHPRVLIAGQDLAARVTKQGSFETTDLALLSVEESALPVSLRLRRNPLCTEPPKPGMQVINVVPDQITLSQIISPSAIAPNLRTKFYTLIAAPEASGSGLFDANRKCLLGIMSAEVPKYIYQMKNGHIAVTPNSFAGYFVSAAKIKTFLPPDFASKF